MQYFNNKIDTQILESSSLTVDIADAEVFVSNPTCVINKHWDNDMVVAYIKKISLTVNITNAAALVPSTNREIDDHLNNQ